MGPKDGKRTPRGEEKEASEQGGLDLGVFGLEGLLGGLERIVKLAERVERSGGEMKKEGELRGPEGLRGVYGFRIRTALGGRGRPAVETFGNIRRGKEGEVRASDAREPLVDVFDEPDVVVVVAELPGVTEQHVTVALSGRTLSLSAEEGDRKYSKEITLPAEVEAGSQALQYTNGILKLTYRKRKPAAGAGSGTGGRTR